MTPNTQDTKEAAQRFPTQPIPDAEITMPADEKGVGWIEQMVQKYAYALCEDIADDCLVIDVQRRFRQFEYQIDRLRVPQWHPFNKDDESTYPPRNLNEFWMACDQPDTDRRIELSNWYREDSLGWSHITHWQLFVMPQPPQ